MRSVTRMMSALFLGAALLLPAAYSMADTAPTDLIKARQDHMKEMGKSLKAIDDQVKSGTIDKASATAAAMVVAKSSKEIPTWFPKGTGAEAGVKTAAKPEIWAMPEDFKKAAAALPPEAEKLVAVVGTGDATMIAAQFKAVGGACGGCHKPFRVPPPPPPAQ